jgi:hypothetical protein
VQMCIDEYDTVESCRRPVAMPERKCKGTRLENFLTKRRVSRVLPAR